MRLCARAFRVLIGILGVVLFGGSILPIDLTNPYRLAIFLAIAMAVATSRVGLPTPAGTLRLSFIVLLAAMAQIPLSQVVLLGAVTGLIESLSPRPATWRWTDSAFQTTVTVLGVIASCTVFYRIVSLEGVAAWAMALPLAATTLFLVTAFPLACVVAMDTGEGLRAVWQEGYLWALPYYLSGGALAALFPASQKLPAWESIGLILPVLYLVYRAYALQIEHLERQKKQAGEMAALQTQMLEALALTLEAKDHGTHDHLRRVTIYVREIGKELGLRGEDLKALHAAALLHDIGKMAVPEHIISKPARLTPEEFERLKVHPLVGADIIERARFAPGVADIVRAHHEKFDGTGYPFGLRGVDIPLGARILSAVDCMDALASHRQYRRALPLEQAVEHIKKEAGKSFDPTVVEVLERRYKDLEDLIPNDSAPDNTRHRLSARLGNGRPAAGYASDSETLGGAAEVPDFLTAIAAARREEQLLSELTHVVGSTLNLPQSLGMLSKRMTHIIPHETLVLWVRRGDHLFAECIVGEHHSVFSSVKIAVGAGLSGWVADARKPVLNGNPAVEPVTPQGSERLQQFRSALSVPLESPKGVLGVLTLYSTIRDAYHSDQLRLILALAPRLTTAVEHSLQFREAESMAAVDFLTGLPNAGALYVHLQNEVARAHRNNSTLAILVCDLDGFKQVNDRFGHLTGNKVLQGVAKGMKDHCREYDFVARMGGDEFVIALPGLGPEGVRTKRQRFGQVARSVGQEQCGEDIVGLSIGEAHFPADGTTPDQLLARADERMYQAKHNAKLLAPMERRGTAHDWLARSMAEG